MPPLRAYSLEFAYSSDHEILSGLSLSLGERARVALAGPNGGGKSTLLRVLAGRLVPDGGSVSSAGEVRLLEQHADPRAPASGGERRLAALREAFGVGAAVLLLDEPTNDLDGDARRWLREAIRSATSALLIVSHDPIVLDEVDEIWELRAGKIQRHPPGHEAYVARLDAEEARLRAELDSLRAAGRRAETRAREVVERQRKRMSRGEARAAKANLPKIIRGARERQAQRLLAHVSATQEARLGRLDERAQAARRRLREVSMFDWDPSPTRPPAGRRLLEVRDVRLDGWRRSLSFDLVGPRRVLLRGANGSGKSTLLRALAGDADARARLTVGAGGALRLAPPFRLFDQDLARFGAAAPLWEWFREGTGLDVPLARAILGRLGFEQDEAARPVSALSGGERVRLELALALHAAEPPQLLLLDEPTNHLDLESRRILRDFFGRFAGGLVVVTHDEAFAGSLGIEEVIDIDACR